MSGPVSRLSKLASHLAPTNHEHRHHHRHNLHTLSPTIFLPRAAFIEPNVRFSHVKLVRGSENAEVTT